MDDIKFEPHCAPCFNFLRGTREEKLTVWLTPVVIKQKEDRTVVTWSCNWGAICESGCYYAHKDIGEVG